MPLSISLNRSGDKRMRTAAKTRDDINNYNGDSPAAAAVAVYRPPQANRPSPRRPSAGGGGGGSSGWLQPIWGLISPSPSPVGAAPTSPPSPPRTARNGRLSAMGSRSRSAHPSLSGTAASPPSPSALSLTSSPTSLDSAMDLPDSPPHSAHLSILPRESSLGRMNVPPFFNTDPPPPLPGAARFKTVTHPQVYRGSATNQVDVSETDPWVSVEHRWLALEERRLDLEERRLGLAARMLTLLETQAAQQPVVAQPSHEPVSVGKLVEPSLPVAAPATATATSTRNGAAANAAAAPKVAAVKSANDITDEPPMVFNSYCWRNSRTQVNSEIKQGQNKPSALQAVGPLDPRDVHKWLIDKGFESWLDVAKLGDGEPLFSQLVEALSRASIVVAYISDEYVKSDNCKKEWFFAKHQLKLAVIPVIVGDKPKSGDYPRWMLSEIGFDMGNVLYIDARLGDTEVMKAQIIRAVSRQVALINKKRDDARKKAKMPPSLFDALRRQSNVFEAVKSFLDHFPTNHTRKKAEAILEPDPFDLKTPLHLACELGHVSCIRLFLHALVGEVDVHEKALMLKDASGATCLFLATAAGQIEVVKLLLDGMPTGTLKAQLSSSNREFRTPLHVAAGYNQVDIARILLEKGADVHAVEANKMTPLGVASQMGSTDVALLLLNNEPPADPSAIDWSHRNPLHIACETRKLEFARMLLDADKPWSDKLNPNAVDLQKRTPLIIAVFQHDAAMVALLLGTGRCQFNYRRPSNYGDTALSIAAAAGLTDILQLLLEAGADTEPLDMGYRTPIINASIQNHPEAIGLLMKAGANINHYPNGDGFNGTAIYYAAYNNFRVTAEILLSDPSIDLELPYSDGTTPLLAAAMRGNGDIVDILLKAGASADAKTKEGRTFASSCAIGGLVNVLEHVVFQEPETKKRLLLSTSDPDGEKQWTLLHYAVSRYHSKLVRKLVEWGANVNATNSDGETPLALLCSSYRYGEENGDDEVEIAQVLIQAAGALDRSLWQGLIKSAINCYRDKLASTLIEWAGSDVSKAVLEDPELLKTAFAGPSVTIIQMILRRSSLWTPEALTKIMVNGISSFYDKTEAREHRLRDAVKLFLDAGADLCESINGKTALHACCSQVGTVSTFELLMTRAREKSVDLAKMLDEAEKTVLHTICLQQRPLPTGRRLEMARIVLNNEKSSAAKDSILNRKDKDGKTPLDCALTIPRFGDDMDHRERAGLVDLLFQHMGDIAQLSNLRGKDGETLLMRVSAAGLTDVVKSMIKSARTTADGIENLFERDDIDGNTVFHYAAKARKFGTIELLVKEYFDTALSETDGEAPTSNGAAPRQIQGVARSTSMTTAGAAKFSLNSENVYGETPLCSLEIQKPWSSFGSSIDDPDSAEDAPLKAVHILLQYGADPWTASFSGKTPLRTAIFAGLKGASIVETLLDAMKVPQSYESISKWRDRTARMPLLNSAVENSYPASLDFLERILLPGPLLDAMRTVDGVMEREGKETAIHVAADGRRTGIEDTTKATEALIRAGMRWWSRDKDGRTPLWRAAKYGRGPQEEGVDRLVELLCETAKKRSVKDKSFPKRHLEEHDAVLGLTPLFVAACNGNLGSVRVLMRYGAESTKAVGSVNGETFAHVIACGGLVAVLEELLDSKPMAAATDETSMKQAQQAMSLLLADDNRGWKPISYAGAAGRDDAVDVILTRLAVAAAVLGVPSTFVVEEARRAVHFAARYGQVLVAKRVIDRFQSEKEVLDDILNTGEVCKAGSESSKPPQTALAQVLGTQCDINEFRDDNEVESKNLIEIAELIKSAGGRWSRSGDDELGEAVASAFESVCQRKRSTSALVEYMLEKDECVKRACLSDARIAGRILCAVMGSKGILNGSDGTESLRRFVDISKSAADGPPAAPLLTKEDARRALHIACSSGTAHTETLKLLVTDLGADVHSRLDLDDGLGPLPPILRGSGIRSLIEDHGADPASVHSGVHPTSGVGWTRNVLHAVRTVSDATAVRDALKRTLDGGTVPFATTWLAMLTARDADGWTPLHWAVSANRRNERLWRQPELAAWLVAEVRGACGDGDEREAVVRAFLNARTAAGTPAVHFAVVQDSNPETLLAIEGTDAAATTGEAEWGAGSALHALLSRSAQFNENYLTEAARKLVRLGVPFGIKDAIKGQTAAEVAGEKGYVFLAQTLERLAGRH